MNELLISCRDVRKIYHMGGEDVHALDGVSLSIGAGDYVAIMGPSGSGKSTMMNLLGALDTPTSGSLSIGGEDISGYSPAQLSDLRNRVIGFVFQQFNLLSRTTAIENVKLPLRYSKRVIADPDAAARRRLEQVGLGSRMDHHPAQMSGGQQQRVAIARALINDPQVILADEPTGALDTDTSNDIMSLFETLNAQGATIILVTHEEEVAERARRIVRLRDGKIVADEKRAVAA